MNNRRWHLVPLLALAFVLAACGSAEPRPLRPIVPTPTKAGVVVDGTARVVTFTDLNSNPAQYLNQIIQVRGSYTPLQPRTCSPQKGPNPGWALVAEGLQLDAVGLDGLLQLAPDGMTVTVEGVWRLYQGPDGCGKEPSTRTVWYLQARRVVRPNPLIAGMSPADEPTETPLDAAPGAPETPPDVTPLPPDAGELTFPEDDFGVTPTFPATLPPVPTATATATTPPVGTATPTATASPTPVLSPTAPTVTGTPPTATPTPTFTPTPDGGGGGFTFPTVTPSGTFVPPTPGPTFTPTPAGYPAPEPTEGYP